MQTSKYLFAAGMLAVVILPLQVQGGPDNEEQAKLRDALRRALVQPNAPQSQPAPAAQPAAAPEPTEPAPTPPPAQPQSQPAAVTPVAPPPVTPTVVVQTPETYEPVPAPDDAASIARAREAMRRKLEEMQTDQQPAPAPGTPVAAVAPAPAPKPAPTPAPAPKTAATPVATSSYKPVDAPASPLPASKQSKLADLLARYRADSITAQEYHAQRAAIIAEP